MLEVLGAKVRKTGGKLGRGTSDLETVDRRRITAP
jgi:hypothetical protein